MAISASLVKELRERTGVGMMDCRKALEASNGDIDQAIEEMRKSGQAKAEKKAGRVASEGIIVVKSENQRAVMIEINCETDFVARDENFIAFSEQLGKLALHQKITDIAQLETTDFSDGKTVKQLREALVAKIGENIQLRRVQYIEADSCLGSYVHGGGRIAVLVDMSGGNTELAKDIAMHIAAMSPQAVSGEDIPEDVIAKEKEVFIAQAEQSGKPKEIIDKMVVGRLKKFLNEVSLQGQPFVRDPSKTVSDLLKEQQAKVNAFYRFEVGEGIEKEQSNFAEEVQAVVKGD